jgi:ABC-type transporter Mla MlaB component
MLQIEIEERTDSESTLILKGELSGTSALELLAEWQEFRRLCPGSVCTADMSSVSVMDEAGQRAICALAHDGVRFLARGPMLGHVIDLVCKASVETSQAGHGGFRSIVFNG